MKLLAKGVYLGINSRTGADGKTYSNVNLEVDDELYSFSTRDASVFNGIPKYTACTFELRYGTYRNKSGVECQYMRIESATPVK